MRSLLQDRFFILAFFVLFPALGFALGNERIRNFKQAKQIARSLHRDHAVTIYCPCRYEGHTIDLSSCGYQVHKDEKRANRLEWEHVVAAENFGRSFVEWREGVPQCVSKSGKHFKGRKCAETNDEFNRMEADLYNLWPVVGELNGLRSNFQMAMVSGDSISFGKCLAKVGGRQFEPMDQDKGVVARTHLYFDLNYPGRGVVSEKNRKLFEVWDRQYPVTDWECERGRRIAEIQGNANQILQIRCPVLPALKK